MIETIRSNYLPERLELIDSDFLEFEEELTSPADKELLCKLLSRPDHETIKLENPCNSILLYVTGLTDTFNARQGRADMMGGSPPDVDMDFESIARETVIEKIVEKWGRENVATIAAYGKMKPKSITGKYLSAKEAPPETIQEIKKMIPPPRYGFESPWSEIMKEHPELETKFPVFMKDALKLEDMIAVQTMHAAGLVIHNEQLANFMPLLSTKKGPRITQFDKVEVEEIGALKFDFLAIDNLTIIRVACELIERNHGIKIDPWKVPDNDMPTYRHMWNGHLAGVFQFETSSSIARLTADVKPTSIDELSDISALNRPGPMEAGFPQAYVKNKHSGTAPDEMVESMKAILKKTNYVVIYQETVMEICSKLAGFSLKEADDIRRALGKKDHKKLDKYKERFLGGIVKNDITEEYAEQLWKELEGFASYALTT